jgi:hypothetical protein
MSVFEQSVLSDLESRGWTIGKPHPGREGAMYRANDGAGSSDAQTILVKDSIAVVTSHRGDVGLPAPWRAGREARDGSPTAFITARDLGIGLATIRHAPSRAALPQPVADPLDPSCVSGVRAAWDAKVFPRDDHPQFVKGGVWVHPCGLREFPRGHRHAGDLIAPMFRPVAPGSLRIELCGAQQLVRDTSKTPDKYVVSGSRSAGAFVPLPIRDARPIKDVRPIRDARLVGGSFFENGAIDRDWLPDGARIVVTEGVRTGQAVRTATAPWAASGGKETVVLAALSAHNLPAVARWLKASGLAASHDVVIAADNDLGKSDFVGIKKAVEAAEICGGKVALVDNNKPGFDAHDLLKERKHDLRAGLSAVREFIESARPPGQVRADRAEAFDTQRESQSKDRGKEGMDAIGHSR